MRSFAEVAVKLARNPLGVIALFVMLIYGIACFTFTSGKNLPPQMIPCFVIFILVYPFAVLWVFYILVTKHHTKLYAPKDFPRPGNFMECAYGDQQYQITREEAARGPSTVPKPSRKEASK